MYTCIRVCTCKCTKCDVYYVLVAGGAIKKKVKSGKVKGMSDPALPPLVAKVNDTIYVSTNHCIEFVLLYLK